MRIAHTRRILGTAVPPAALVGKICSRIADWDNEATGASCCVRSVAEQIVLPTHRVRKLTVEKTYAH